MAMCKECGQVVGSSDIENGICKSCRVKGVKSVKVDSVETEDNMDIEVEMSNFGNPFSFKGRSGQLDYLVYGIIVPYALLGLGFYISTQTGSPIVLLIGIILAIFIGLAATVRRVRDRGDNIILVIILSLIPYLNFIVMLYLLVAPSKKGGQSSNIIAIIAAVVFVVFLIGILAAVAIPKFAAVKSPKVETTCLKMKNISQRLAMFKLDNNTYPSTEEGIRILVDRDDNKYPNYSSRGYMKKIPTDSFGNEFLYYSKSDGEFEITSDGEDGRRGSSDDIIFSECSN